MTPDERVRRLCGEQRGYITWKQMIECGLTERQGQHRITKGGLDKVAPGVYRSAGVPDAYEGRLMAIQLWMGKEGFLSHTTAAHLLGLDGIEQPSKVHVLKASSNACQDVTVHRLRKTHHPQTRWVRGIKICNVERILLDIAGMVSPARCGRALDDALRRRLTTLDRMWSVIAEGKARGQKGAGVLRRLLQGRDQRDAKVRSVFEAKMLRILKRIQDHDFVPDFKVVVGGQTYFLDFYLPFARIAIECHSIRWHLGGEGLKSDAKRDRKLGSIGIEVLYFTWDEVMFEEREVEAEIRKAITRRELLLFTNL